MRRIYGDAGQGINGLLGPLNRADGWFEVVQAQDKIAAQVEDWCGAARAAAARAPGGGIRPSIARRLAARLNRGAPRPRRASSPRSAAQRSAGGLGSAADRPDSRYPTD